MKCLLTIIFLTLRIDDAGLFAQNDSCGIYISWQDYVSGRMSYPIKCHSSKDKIKLHDSFSGRYMEVIINGNLHRFCKDSIFGYRDCNHHVYRFYRSYDSEYRIEENMGIVIYTSYISVPPSDVKHYQFFKTYFFSVTVGSVVYPLTIPNLERAYPKNLKFHDMLGVTFGDGLPVYVYDTERKMYKINYLFRESLNNP